MTSGTPTAGSAQYAAEVTPRQHLRMLLGGAFYGVMVFGPAGSLRWVEGWVFLAILLGAAVAGIRSLRRADTGLLEERTSGLFRDGQPIWDRLWLIALVLLSPAWIALAGLDAVRFGWTSLPWWLEAVGGIAFVLSLLLIGRVMLENPFASHVVRIQEERGQRVIESGPYAVVRHPMYSAMLLLFPGGSLLLGSLLSLAIALLICLLAVVRVPLEESLLRRGLPGYDEYRERVRFRLIPHIW